MGDRALMTNGVETMRRGQCGLWAVMLLMVGAVAAGGRASHSPAPLNPAPRAVVLAAPTCPVATEWSLVIPDEWAIDVPAIQTPRAPVLAAEWAIGVDWSIDLATEDADAGDWATDTSEDAETCDINDQPPLAMPAAQVPVMLASLGGGRGRSAPPTSSGSCVNGQCGVARATQIPVATARPYVPLTTSVPTAPIGATCRESGVCPCGPDCPCPGPVSLPLMAQPAARVVRIIRSDDFDGGDIIEPQPVRIVTSESRPMTPKEARQEKKAEKRAAKGKGCCSR